MKCNNCNQEVDGENNTYETVYNIYGYPTFVCGHCQGYIPEDNWIEEIEIPSPEDDTDGWEYD